MQRLIRSASWLALAAAGAAQAQPGTVRFDNWGYFQSNIGGAGQWQYRPRIFLPYGLGGDWTTTTRFDLPMLYTNQAGRENPDGKWETGIGNWFVDQSVGTPELAPNFRMSAGVRLVAPTAKGPPFGADQWQWAPSVGASYALPGGRIVLAPLVRYFFSFHATESGASQIRSLNLFPAVRFGLPDGWTLAFYPENPIAYNDVTNKWFVPIDALLVKRVSERFEFGFGGAWGLVKDNPQYRYIVNGRATWYF